MTPGLEASLLFGAAAMVATLVGGVVALRWSHRIALVLALSAGIVLGVALFDLLPEAISLASGAYQERSILSFGGLGLVLYMLFDRALSSANTRRTRWRAHLGPATLAVHSLLDGVGIGLAFQISEGTGWAVALAVLTHDVADGVNTVGLALAADQRRAAKAWLGVNALMPMLGVLIGQIVHLPAAMLAPTLAVLAGVFLYIGGCHLLPRSFELRAKFGTTALTVAGMVLMYAVSSLA